MTPKDYITRVLRLHMKMYPMAGSKLYMYGDESGSCHTLTEQEYKQLGAPDYIDCIIRKRGTE